VQREAGDRATHTLREFFGSVVMTLRIAADHLRRATMTIRALGAPTPPAAAPNGASPNGTSSDVSRPPETRDQPYAVFRTPTDETASLNLDQLAGAIGLHPDEVLRRLANGEGLGDRLSAAADTSYGSTVGSLIRGGILVDRYA
jgi:hypothetical protein